MSQNALWAGNLLHGYIASLNACNGDEDAENLSVAEAIKMMIPGVLDVVARSSCQEATSDIMDQMINFLILLNGLGRKARSNFAASLLGDFLDFIVNSFVAFEYRLGILKNINIIMENCSMSMRHNLLSKDDFVKKLCCLFKTIYESGDYEFQVCITEFLYRVIPKPYRAEIIERAQQSSSVTELFLSIRESHFETDCRSVLNKLNEQNENRFSRVYSFPAESVKLDGEKIYKPSDDSYEEFWVDFNTISKRICLFIEPNFPQSQEGEVLWEIVSLWKSDVARCDCLDHGSFCKAVIELKPGAQIFSSKDPDDQPHLIAICVSMDYPLRDALLGTFGEKTVNVQAHPKASSVPSPVSVSIGNAPSAFNTMGITGTVVTNRIPSSSAKTGPHTLSSNYLATSSQLNRCGAKTSVPMEPMRTPASSVISSNEDFSWHKIQAERKKDSTEEKGSQNKTHEDPAHSIEKDHHQIGEQRSKKCSVSFPVVIRYISIANPGDNNGNKTCAYNKTSAVSGQESNTEPQHDVTDISDEHSENIHLKQVSHPKICANESQFRSAENQRNAKIQGLDEADSLALEDEDHGSSVRRSQRNINKQRTVEKQRNHSTESIAMKNDERSKSKTTLNNNGSTKNIENYSHCTLATNNGYVESFSEKNFKEAKTPPPKSLRSSKKVKTPVVTVQAPKKTPDSKSERISSGSNIKEDYVATTTPSFDVQSYELRLDKGKASKDNHVHNHEMVQEPTISSVFEEKKREASKFKNRKNKHDNESPHSSSSELLKKNFISPGVSEEDFKHPKMAFHLGYSKKVKRKGKKEKKNQSGKSTSRQPQPIDDKAQKGHDLDKEREALDERNMQESKSIKQVSRNAETKNDPTKEINDEYGTNKKRPEQKDRSEGCRKLSDKPEVVEGELQQKDGVQVSAEKIVSKDHLDDKTKDKRRFHPPGKKLNCSEPPSQGTKFAKDSWDTSQSCTKSERAFSQKDPTKRVNSPVQTVADTSEKHESKSYGGDKMVNEREETKFNSSTSDKDNNVSRSPAGKRAVCFQERTTKTNKHKRNHVLMKLPSFDDVSSSNSGFLYIETSHETNDLDHGVVGETQCDKPTQQSQDNVNSSPPIEPTQWQEINKPNKVHEQEQSEIKGKANLPAIYGFEEDELNASGDYNFSTELQVSSNMESSYVFNKSCFQKNNANTAKALDHCAIMSPSIQDLSYAECGKNDCDQTKKIEPRNLTKEIKGKQNKNYDKALSIPAGGCGDGVEILECPEGYGSGRLLRQLRERNKKVSYKEWESFEASDNEKKTHQSTKLSYPCSVGDEFKEAQASLEMSPSDDKRKSQNDQRSMKIFGSMAPKKAPKESSRQRRTFWTSKEIKTTVTTMSYSKTVQGNDSDPYNFEADCATTSTEAAPLAPFRSFSLNKDSLNLTQDVQNQHVVEGKRDFSLKTKRSNKKARQENYSKVGFEKASTQHKSQLCTTSCAKKSEALKFCKKKKKACAKESEEFTLFSSQRDVKKRKEKKSNTIESMEFTLFSSQKSQLEVSKKDSGLVFPPLEDAIPCTPYDDIASVASDDVIEKSSRKSALSECSWMKSKTPLTVQRKMRGKTYDKSKKGHEEHQVDSEGNTTEAEDEHGPLYQKLHNKQHKQRSSDMGTKMHKAHPQTLQRQKVLGSLEMEVTPGRSPGPVSLYKNLASSTRWKEEKKEKPEKIVSSILTNSSKRSKNSSIKKSKRSLSFKSPSDHGSLENDEVSDDDIYQTVSHEDMISSSKRNQHNDVPISSIASGEHSKGKRHTWGAFESHINNSSWQGLTSKLDHQTQGMLEEVSDCLDPDIPSLKKTDSLCSGPCKRPRRSFLKRNYTEQLSSCSEHGDTSETDGNENENMSMPKKLFKIDLSPRSILKSTGDTCKAPRTPKKKLLSHLSANDFSPLNLNTPTLVKAHGRTPNKIPSTKASPKGKKRKSQRKLELSPMNSRPNEDYGARRKAAKPVPSFDFISSVMSSPEKARDCSHVMSKHEKELCISPYIPLSVSIDGSPVIGLQNLSSLELCQDIDTQEEESPPGPTALLDTIKDDLMKPLTSQRSEVSSEDFHCTQMIALAESSRSEIDQHTASATSYDSLRDFLTRKNMTKRPSLVNELEDVTRQTVKCIGSKWDDEQRKRKNALKRFQNITENVLTCMSRDVKEIAEWEKASAILWEQQIEKLRKQRRLQEKELVKLKNAHQELTEQLQQDQSQTKMVQRDVKAVLKKDIEGFKKTLEEKYNEHSLEAMKRCLQTSFLFS